MNIMTTTLVISTVAVIATITIIIIAMNKGQKEVKLTIEEPKPTVVTKKKKVTKSSLRTMKKGELIKLAKSDFDTDFDSSLTKTNLVNKVYQLYHKK
tara:strand:+ start:542 stop:832 length:291 start_codon:yes stop_codon:yes gene_type:complete